MVTTEFKLKYCSNIGFATDQGGRGFQLPAHINMRSDGRIFVASRGRGPTVGVQMVSKEFEFFGKIGSSGSGVGQMLEPSALAFDSKNNLYVADEKLNRITSFNEEGVVINSWGESGSEPGRFHRPTGMLIIDDIVFVTDAMNHRIQRYTLKGKFLGQWGMNGSGEGEFNYPWGIAKGNDGDIYIADWGNNRVVNLTIGGEFISEFHEGIGSEIPLNKPADVDVDADGNIYIADWGNQRLQVFDSHGKFLYVNRGEADLNPWALEYFESQQDEQRARSSYVPIYETDTDDIREISARIEPYFWDPCSVMVDGSGRVYVLETCRHRFQMFDRV